MNHNPSAVIHGHVSSHCLADDGTFPNNERLPVLVYKGALNLHPDQGSDFVKDIFEQNNWKNSWVDGIFNYHHYHSTTHEVLGITCGHAEVQLGGDHGICVELVRSDVVIIPAGVAHKALTCSADFECVGAYPDGKEYDLKKGEAADRPLADQNIKEVAIPKNDPVFGTEGPLVDQWKSL